MTIHSQILIRATIPPGETAEITARATADFQPGRLTISPASFPVSRTRRVLTWPSVTIGRPLWKVRRVLASLLGVDLYASPRELRRDYLDDDAVSAHVGSLRFDDEADRYYVPVLAPPNRRERALTRLARVAALLSGPRERWQAEQLASVLVCDIKISGRTQLPSGGGPLPVDLFHTPAIDSFVSWEAAPAGHDIKITVHNGNRRLCNLVGALTGITRET